MVWENTAPALKAVFMLRQLLADRWALSCPHCTASADSWTVAGFWRPAKGFLPLPRLAPKSAADAGEASAERAVAPSAAAGATAPLPLAPLVSRTPAAAAGVAADMGALLCSFLRRFLLLAPPAGSAAALRCCALLLTALPSPRLPFSFLPETAVASLPPAFLVLPAGAAFPRPRLASPRLALPPAFTAVPAAGSCTASSCGCTSSGGALAAASSSSATSFSSFAAAAGNRAQIKEPVTQLAEAPCRPTRAATKTHRSPVRSGGQKPEASAARLAARPPALLSTR